MVPASSVGSSVVAGVMAALGALSSVLGSAASAIAGALGGALSAIGSLLAAIVSAVISAVSALGVGLAGAVAALAASLSRHPERLLTPVAGAGAAWAVTSFQASLPKVPLRAAFVSLFSRLEHHELLRHDTRQRIFDFVQQRPGAHVSQISQAMGIGWGTTVYHLQRLREGQLLNARAVGNQLCHFVNGSSLGPAEQTALAATKAPKAQAMVDYLKLRGPTAQHALAHELGMSTALVSWHAKRLEDLGVVARTRRGRLCVLALTAPAPQAKPATAVVRPLPAPTLAA
jgi:DNA-binding transcriptional ArsR family regulator